MGVWVVSILSEKFSSLPKLSDFQPKKKPSRVKEFCYY